MNQQEFETYLDSRAESSATTPTGRVCKDAFGQDAIIVLPKNYWDYVDWLTEHGIDINDWVVECDKHRDEKTLSENFMEWLYWDECDRHRNGYVTPTDTPPIGYQE